MTYRETRYVAESVRQMLVDRCLLNRKIKITETIAGQIDKARRVFATNDETEISTRLTDGMSLLKTIIHARIPRTFGWWMEIDNDVNLSIRWIWLGHPSVVHCGGIQDTNITILLELLKLVDWAAEAHQAMENVEKAEAFLLSAAQERRRLKLTTAPHLLALPPVELIPDQAKSLQEKKIDIISKSRAHAERPKARLTKEEIEERLKPRTHQPKPELKLEEELYSDESDETSISAKAENPPDPIENENPIALKHEATYEQRHAATSAKTRRINEDGLQPLRFGLCRQMRRPVLREMQFEEFQSLNALLEAIERNLPGTFTEAYVNLSSAIRIKGADEVWKMIGRGPMAPERPNNRPIREYSDREFARLDSGDPKTPRDGSNRFSRYE